MRIIKLEERKETLGEAMAEFIAAKVAKGLAETTIRDYRRFLDDFLEFSSNTLDDEILLDEVCNFFASIPDTSPARYNHPFQNLNSFFKWAIKKNKLKTNPIAELELHKKKDDGCIKPASIEDIKKLLNSFDKSTFAGLRNYLITLLMIDTGIRTSELRRLKDSDLDINGKQILISKHISKTKKNRIVYLSDTTVKLLIKLINAKPEGFSELLFPTIEGQEMSCERLSNEFYKQSERAGVKITPYQLRHSFASYYISNGGDVFTLQNLMGHADLRMTKRYVEIDENQKKQAHKIYSPVNALQGASRLVKIG